MESGEWEDEREKGKEKRLCSVSSALKKTDFHVSLPMETHWSQPGEHEYLNRVVKQIKVTEPL